jgi:hypothetical protein
MKRDATLTFQILALAALLGLTLACGGPSPEAQEEAEEGAEEGVRSRVEGEVEAAKADAASAEGAVAGAPQVSETYQSTINRGWEEAAAGETPAYACAGLKGRLVGTGKTADPAALEALYACNVLLPVRYFETLLEGVEAGDKTCHDFMMAMTTQLSAMTISVDSIEGMADALDETPEAAAAGTVAAALDEGALEQGLTDPKRAVKDRLREPVEKTCPNLASVVLR